MQRGEIWWAHLPAPTGSEPGFRRPVLIVQADLFNRSRLRTVVVVAITSNLLLAELPGNVRVGKSAGLATPSVINVTAMMTLDRSMLQKKAGNLSPQRLAEVDEGLRLVLGLAAAPRT